MKISGEVKYYPMDGDVYVLETYLPEKEVYVAVHNCDDEWSYEVSDQSVSVYDRKIIECYEDVGEFGGSEYADTMKMLRGMINVMRLAND